MSYCTPCPPCDTNFPLLCEPLETTANGKRLVVEDSAACQKTIQTPVAQQVLKTDGAGNLTWTNGANNTVLVKDSTGKVEFAQVTTDQIADGTIVNADINAAAAIAGTKVNPNFGLQIVNSGGAISKNTTVNGYVSNEINSNDEVVFILAASGTTNRCEVRAQTDHPISFLVNAQEKVVINRGFTDDAAAEVSIMGSSGTIDIYNSLVTGGYNNIVQAGDKAVIFSNGTQSTGNFVIAPWRDSTLTATGIRMEGSTGDIGIHTSNPARPLHVTGFVRLQGLSTYANNAAAISGGLVADDVYKTSTGELRIVV
jgi:hypothetical protein